jgi:hypothetical protein
LNPEQAVVRPAIVAARAAAESEKKAARPFRLALLPLIALAVVAAGAVRTGHYYEPGDNVGYWLGVAGGVMMLALLLYSLRKHIGFMHRWGPTRHWFRLHMFLGIAGPTFILFHSTFHAGSLNAMVALACMLLVAGSGVIGRVIYRKIHHGLYGRRATLQEIQTRLGISEGDVNARLHFDEPILQRLKDFQTHATVLPRGLGRRVWVFLTVGLYSLTTRALHRNLKQRAAKQAWDGATLARRRARGKKIIRAHLNAVVDVARFNAYERLFSLWHILHIPFVFMLIISGIVHVIAVHMY